MSMPSSSFIPDILSRNLSFRGRRSRTSSRQSSYQSYSVYQQAMASLTILRDPDATKALLETILDSPGGKRSLSRLARTCKGICETALNVLWRELDSLVPLIGLFPNHLLRRTRRPGLGLTKPPAEEDWSRVLSYGKRVRRIAYNESANNVSASIFPIIDEYRPQTYILPNLTSLTWRVDTAAGLERCLLFLTPEVKTVVLDINNKVSNLRDILKQLSNRNRLHSLSFTSHVALPEDFTDIFHRQNGLVKLSLNAPGALSSAVGKWVSSQPKLRFLELDLTARSIVAVEGFFEEIMPRSGYSTPSSVGGTDSGVFSADEPDFSDIRKSALRLTGDAPLKGVCPQLQQLQLTGEAANIAAFMKHLNSRLAVLDLIIDDPPETNDWHELATTICEQFGGFLQVLKLSAVNSKFIELVRSTSRDVPIKPLSLEYLTFLPNLHRLDIDLPESVIFSDSDVAHIAKTCPNIEVLRLCPLAKFTTAPPSLTLEGLIPLTTECPRLHTLAVVVDGRSGTRGDAVERAPSSRSLLRLHVGHSWVKDPFRVAITLSHLSPYLDNLKWFQEKNRAVIEEHAKGWQQVSDFLPYLQHIRLSERRKATVATRVEVRVKTVEVEVPVIPPKPKVSEQAIDATPVVIDQGVLARPRLLEASVQSSPETVDEGVEASPAVSSKLIDATPVVQDEEVYASPAVSEIGVEIRPPASSATIDATTAISSKNINTNAVAVESNADTMSDVSTSSSSSSEYHRPHLAIPFISGIFTLVKDVFVSYPVYLSLRLLNASLFTLGARSSKHAETSEAVSEKLSTPAGLILSPSPAVTDHISPVGL
ncbi:hypothetical protein NEOLEDRAFT_1126367 [Neolentinus lepideus HHB14362 ss-1]|uniref:F-box domain-containing protein n=1 Tax=Neolentinus lepideus HHB14362 ss-1 TaxID=1314782 RepID=A0A165W6N3_9AGAM|nr:hypothetical protein NEOLEDRAFT_1126367 [Neolentinus lepideus HHB14362 ss-1]